MAMTTTGRPAAAGLAVVLAIALGAPAVRAQSEFRPRRAPGWTFTPGITFGTWYDTNVALAALTDTGETEGDTALLMQPSGRLDFLGKHTTFSGQYAGLIRRHRQFDALNGYEQRIGATLTQQLSRSATLTVRNAFDDVPTTDDIEVNGVLFARRGVKTNNLTASVEGRVARHTRVSGGYQNTWLRFDDDPDTTARLSGGQLHAFRGGISQELTQRLDVGGEYSLRFATIDEGDREFTFQDVGATLGYRLARHTTLSAGAGASLLHDRLSGERRTGPYYRAAVTQTTAVARMGAGFQRTFLPAFGFGASTRTQELTAFIETPLPHRVYLNNSFSWRNSVPFDADDLRVETAYLRSLVGYAITPWMRLQGFYQYTRQDSLLIGGRVARHRIGTQLVLSQPLRIP